MHVGHGIPVWVIRHGAGHTFPPELPTAQHDSCAPYSHHPLFTGWRRGRAARQGCAERQAETQHPSPCLFLSLPMNE